ncbi:uncharacterized protein MYCGRDRAFT_106652 [Zymoseptoria tritici IPO323]|uniref:Uncharacterized protein n=1 Tax=Zymoseptoria tritici (strain CBS 115943 / IPO323) TaxID=336722 RepID=F9XRM5_ZYMTI|nr:uncharacterized protein MYCGRDRAFT_106652 [Zymoseptoria tritici IPO323]EGP82102.1 hypothetical protein MYCGRDRAFT_106652 [Zymoseptoria tritici IPO323]
MQEVWDLEQCIAEDATMASSSFHELAGRAVTSGPWKIRYCVREFRPACRDGNSTARGDGHSTARGDGHSTARGDGHSTARGDGHSTARGLDTLPSFIHALDSIFKPATHARYISLVSPMCLAPSTRATRPSNRTPPRTTSPRIPA